MRQKSLVHPAQLPLRFDDPAELERVIEQRVTERFKAEAIRWRLRIVLIEAAVITAVVGSAGLAIGQPAGVVMHAALLVGASCIAGGTLLLGVTVAGSHFCARLRRRRHA
ncbi:hypothetical protein M9978_20260 [Sphingomonas sp. MG17]|uniref:Uncharacterized protein n=1 Tax=Sphingomonas tagetis TaxID=2949092 RepID=A0A9X2HQY1_9SPHN|nr:hypothetical protein [Sphingomonas tagetis]MCP3732756.1 hypothetical protein [Sphingomonas tagetis]